MSEQSDIREQLSAYLDGELSSEQARRVEEALRSDPSLAKELDELKAVRAMVGKLPTYRAPEGFAATVLERAERTRLVEATPSGRGHRLSWGSLATAAVVLIAICSALVVTLKLTLTPSWPDKMASRREPLKLEPNTLAKAPAAAGSERRLALRDESGSSKETAAGETQYRLAVLPPKEKEDGAPLDVVRGRGEVSPGLAASRVEEDKEGTSNVGPAVFGHKFDDQVAKSVENVDGYQSPATAAADEKKDVDSIGQMPAMAAAPDPRADRPAGVVTQVGEPLYRGKPEGASVRSAAEQPAEEPKRIIRVPWFTDLTDAFAYRPSRGTSPEVADRVRALTATPVSPAAVGGTAGVYLARRASGTMPLAMPESGHPASQSASGPTTQPTSQPSTQPTSAPASGDKEGD